MKGKSENNSGQLLLTQEEWSKRSNKGSGFSGYRGRGNGGFRGRGRAPNRGGGTGRGSLSRNEESTKGNTMKADRSEVKCFNCNVYGHYARECRKPKRDKERAKDQPQEVNLSQTMDEEPTLLFTECKEKDQTLMLLSEEGVCPKLSPNGDTAGNKPLVP